MMELRAFQRHMDELYGMKDRRRGAEKTLLWLAEEIGELFRSVRKGNKGEIEEEFADVVAWIFSAANVLGVDLQEAVLRKYGVACPKCGKKPCECVKGE